MDQGFTAEVIVPQLPPQTLHESYDNVDAGATSQTDKEQKSKHAINSENVGSGDTETANQTDCEQMTTEQSSGADSVDPHNTGSNDICESKNVQNDINMSTSAEFAQSMEGKGDNENKDPSRGHSSVDPSGYMPPLLRDTHGNLYEEHTIPVMFPPMASYVLPVCGNNSLVMFASPEGRLILTNFKNICFVDYLGQF